MSSDRSRVEREKLRAAIFNMVSVGVVDEPVNQAYDVLSTVALIVNLAGAFAATFDEIAARFGGLLWWIECITVLFFAVDYVLRLYTARNLYPQLKPGQALIKYVTSFSGVVDLLSFLPYYLPILFPKGMAAFRLIRVVRIMRLFRINPYYDSLNVITEVIVGKRQQLMSSVFIIVVMMMASSLCMYSLEHDAQPEVFRNAFSGIWWSTSTLLTIGYGDIYPVTVMGKVFGILIAFLDVGLVAIPTGIISAGFVEQYQRLKRLGDMEEVHSITLRLRSDDAWVGRRISELGLPHGALIAALERGGGIIPPRGGVVLREGDKLVIGAEAAYDEHPMDLNEVVLTHDHPWSGRAVKDLDIPGRSFLVMVRRRDRVLIPRGSLVLQEGDVVFLYSRHERGEAE